MRQPPFIAGVLAVLVLAPAPVTSAPAADAAIPCEPGMEVGPDTAGHCCWPGQAWAASRRTCVGKAACPAGFSALPSLEGCQADCPEGTSRHPGGAFTMWSAGNQAVAVTPFCLDVTEVTARAYQGCVAAGRCTEPGTGGACTFAVAGKEDHPVNCVDWHQAAAYCGWRGATLPSEQEWEWAARGGAQGWMNPWGNEEPRDQLCWSGRGNDREARGFTSTCAVGSHPRGDTVEGVKDLAGNVEEWTRSRYDAAQLVSRGEGWRLANPKIRLSTVRSHRTPDSRAEVLGFRCSRAP